MSDPVSKTTTCEACDGSGQVDPMLSATDPANGPCETCGGVGAISKATEPTEAEIVAGRLAADAAWQRWTGGRSPLDGMGIFVRDALRAAGKVRSAETHG